MDTIAIVLHQIDYKDSSKILYLYTPSGHASVIAHGVKKLNNVNRFLSQNGTVIRCSLSKSSFPILKDGELIEDYEHIKQDIIAYTYMNHILELVRNTIPEDSDHEKMFQFLQKVFDKMNRESDPEVLSFIVELKLLYFLGTGLHFNNCVICGNMDHLVFHISSGGLICNHHLEGIQIGYEKDVYQWLKDLYYIDITMNNIPDIEGNYRILIRHIIDALYDEFVGYHSKSRTILKQIKKY
ncbi:DNA repair protein RecO [Candidatus Xianfuyuplasma coldseepsis]|uniref:DNA repair protein RecO n=1 Tax=Candidatus Xianfuyuplasma coldseepsis TaxID=2782163 RepID=A0A7L7KVX6_9MOLU|nr:DNA repair protein RecO [Xianfuyuplasma coldseepsis]QMS85908.1 DNA repair protein RecO [Xianfuyuplasma coldseepsis]